jgi:hypothetical protein
LVLRYRHQQPDDPAVCRHYAELIATREAIEAEIQELRNNLRKSDHARRGRAVTSPKA